MSQQITIVPHYYQEEAVNGLFNFFRDFPIGNPIVALPTGTGKSIVIAEFIRRALFYFPSTRVMVATHVKELVDQNFLELLAVWPTAPAGIYSAGLKRRDTHLPITFCGIASVAKRMEEFGFIHLLIIDECHLRDEKTKSLYNKAIRALMAVNPFLKVIGLTATPYRLGLGMLTDGNLFTHITTNYCELDKFNKLVDEGYLCPLVPKRTRTELSVEGVGTTLGEYNVDELQAAVDVDSITTAALNEAYQLARYRRSWLVFCTGTNHADHVRDKLIAMGVSARCVHSNLPGGDKERDENIRAFKNEEFQALVGVGVFTTGFNHRPVDTIIVLRPTLSPILWVQMLGRGTRTCPWTGKTECLVLDFAANTRRLGPINDPVIPRKRGKKGGPAPFKICEACDTYNHTRARFCVCCGAMFPAHVAIETTAAQEELIRRRKAEAEEVPIVAEYSVARVEYQKHISRDKDKPPTLLITYYCGLRIFNEWLCLEHTGYPRHKARDAWRLMSGNAEGTFLDVPDTVDEALELVNYLSPPSTIRVLHKGKWPEVVGYDFTGPRPQVGDPMDFSKGTNSAGKTLDDAVADGDIPF